MFKIMLVDDEPAAIRPLISVIEKKYSQFQIIATAENGRDALTKMEESVPDLVLTDVRMPVMDGIEYARRVKEKFPQVYIVIISGYEDFSYAKDALAFGALDYILKPVSLPVLDEALKKAEVRLVNDLHVKRTKLIRKITTGIKPRQEQIKMCFPSEQYYAAIVRKNGLPRRFSPQGNLEITSELGEMMYLYGRDEMEFLYICPVEFVIVKSFRQLIEGMINKEQDHHSYVTTVIHEQPFSSETFADNIMKLYRYLDKRTIIGKSQMILINSENHKNYELTNVMLDNNSWQKQIEYFIAEKQWHKLKGEMKHLLTVWSEKSMPQLLIEKNIRHVIYLLELHQYDAGSEENLDYMLDDAFFYATCVDDLEESLDYLFSRIIRQEKNADMKMDSQSFVDRIKQYVMCHLNEEISLQTVCKDFGISQTYINKLFRKYEHKTFYNYLIDERIEKAKELMEKNVDFLIKDIAAMVGYGNQFYFSRLFRSVTGMSPSEYAEEMRNK